MASSDKEPDDGSETWTEIGFLGFLLFELFVDAGVKVALLGQVHAPAVFKCVRVTAAEDGEDENAYQAWVKIGGHALKGFL